MSLRVCFVCSEAAPFAKTGGLADVSGALTKYLHGAGHDVRLFMPFYKQIRRDKLDTHPVASLQNVPVQLGHHRYEFSVTEARFPGSKASVHLIECPVLYERSTLYTFDVDEHLRFLLLTRAAFECCQRLQWSPQIIHCHDWHTGFGPLFLKALYDWDALFKGTRSVITIHNIGYQGVFSASAVGDLGLGAKSSLLHQDDLRAGQINALKHGVMYADAITTVSPTYANEICTDEYGMGLQQTLRTRSDALSGILNGVDYDEWDPRHDHYLPLHYGPTDLPQKAALKKQFLERMKLEAGPATPLVGIVSRLASQKGIDLLFDALPRTLASRDMVFAGLGSGDAPYEQFFTKLQQDFPGRVMFHRGYSDELAHWIEAASDVFLMPSLYEPCGLNQMYSMRYGTVPIVRKTGGLADSVQHYDPATGQGTGIVFKEFTAQALTQALGSALDLYAQPAHWERFVRNGMAEDFSWNQQGARYVKLYERLVRS
jgi:starch synthase